MIYGIGETVLDILFRNDQPEKAIPGGSTFNAMISLGRSGQDCAMITQVGDDHVGELTRAYLTANGVSDRYVSTVRGMKSHVSLAFLDENGDAHYSFYKDHRGWDVDALMAMVAEIEFTAEDVLLLGSFFAVNPLVRPVVEKLLFAADAAGAMIYYDLNYRSAHADQLEEVRSYMMENMILASVVRASLDDLKVVYGEDLAHKMLSANDTNDFLFRGKHGVRPFILTDGPNPVRIYTKGGVLSLSTPVLTPVSTVGAGDNFNAGWIDFYVQSGLRSDSAHWSERALMGMARQAMDFSREVCLSWENSINGE